MKRLVQSIFALFLALPAASAAPAAVVRPLACAHCSGPSSDAQPIASADLTISGLSIELPTTPVVAAVDVPASVQTIFNGATNAEAPPAAGMTVVGDLTGPGIDGSIALIAVPGHPFDLPPLHVEGSYALQNVRLVSVEGAFLQQATPASISITVSNILRTDVKVRQLTADELRALGITVDARNYDVFSYEFEFGLSQSQIVVPFVIIVNRVTHEVTFPPGSGPGQPPAPRGPLPPPRFEPPQVAVGSICELPDFVEGHGEQDGGQGDLHLVTPQVPIALVIPSGFGVLHQFFGLVLNVTNGAPAGTSVELDDVSASLDLPAGLRVAKTIPAVTVGQPVPIAGANGASIILAQTKGSAEWSIEGLKPGTHTLTVNVKATFRAPGQRDTPLGGKVSTSLVVSDPRFQINFSHPDNVRAGEDYIAYAFVTNTSPIHQSVTIDMSAIPACGSGFGSHVCRASGDAVTPYEFEPGQMISVPYHLRSEITGHIFAAAANADEALTVNVTLSMGVSASGIPLSPATIVMPYYARFVDPSFLNATMPFLGLAYSLATAPLSQSVALMPRVIPSDVLRRAQDIARAGQRMFIARAEASQPGAETDRVAWFDLSLDLLGNAARVDQLSFAPQLAELDQLRRTESSARSSAAALSRNLESVSPPSTDAFVRSFAQATSHRAPFLLAIVHGAIVPGSNRPYALSMKGGTSGAVMDVPAEATSGWMRALPFGELTQFGIGGEVGELSLIGRWTENIELSVISATGTFGLELVYPDTADGSELHASFQIAGAQVGQSVRFILQRGSHSIVMTGASGTPVIEQVVQAPLAVAGAAQDLYLDPTGRIVSLLLNRPVREAEANALRDALSLTTSIASIGYRVVRRNDPADPNGLFVRGAALQEDARTIEIAFDKPLSTNASYELAISGVHDALDAGQQLSIEGVRPRIDNDAPGGIVFGHLLDGDGQGIAGSLVRLGFNHGLLQYDTTLSQGEFLFEFVPRDLDHDLSGAYDLAAAKGDDLATLTGTIRLPGEVQRVSLVFIGRGSVQGKVSTDDGTAVGGATVTANSTVYGGFFSTTTDAHGGYLLTGLPLGPFTLAAVDSRGAMTFASSQIRSSGQRLQQDLVFQRSQSRGVATVRVIVRRSDVADELLSRVGGAHVGVFTQGYGLLDGYTDANGLIEFRSVPAGFISVLASEFSVSPESIGVDLDLHADSVLEQTLILPVATSSSQSGLVTVEGLVTRDDPASSEDVTRDQPVAGAIVTFGRLTAVTADQSGAFAYSNVPIGYSSLRNKVFVFDPHTGRQGVFDIPTLVPGVNQVKFRLSTKAGTGIGSVRVRLLSASGAPVSGYRVFAPGFPTTEFTDGGSGFYDVKDIAVPRQYSVTALPLSHGTYGSQFTSGFVSVSYNGQVGYSELRLPGQGTVFVKMQIRKPCPPLPETCPDLYDPAFGDVNLVYREWSNQDQDFVPVGHVGHADPVSGLVTFRNVPAAEPMTVSTLANPSGFDSQPTYLAFEGDTRTVVLTLRSLSDLSGRVYSYDGRTPVPGATIHLSGGTANYGTVQSDQDGFFRMPGIAAGQSIEVVADATEDGIYRSGFVDATTPPTGGPVAGLAIILRQQADIAGTVIDDHGAPVAGAHFWVRELSWPDRMFGSAKEPLVADDAGHFAVRNLFAGAFRVSAESPSNQELRGDVEGIIGFEGDSRESLLLTVGGAGTGNVSAIVYDSTQNFQVVPNAEVRLFLGGSAFDFTTTDAHGVAVFEDVPVGITYSLQATSRAVGRSGKSAQFAVTRDGQTSVEVALDFLGTVTGTVMDQDDDPPSLARGLPVTLTSENFVARASSDASGAYRFDGVPELAFHLNVFDPATGRSGNGPDGLFISKLFPERDVPLVLEKTAALRIRAFLPDDSGGPGEPASFTDVQVTQNGGYSRELQGSDLTFVRMFPRSDYSVTVKELNGEQRTVHGGGTTGLPGTTGELSLVFPTTGSVRVSVTLPDGSPVSNAKVVMGTDGRSGTMFTGSTGTVQLDGFPLNQLVGVQVAFENLSAASSGVITTRATPLAFNLTLANRASIYGLVLAEAAPGQPSVGTRVQASVTGTFGNAISLETRTDETGRFEFDGVPVESTTVVLTYFASDDVSRGALQTFSMPAGASGLIVVPTVTLDSTPPRVLAIDPLNNAATVSPGSPVVVTMSEPLSADSVSPSYFSLIAANDGSSVDCVLTSVSGTAGTMIVTLQPRQNLRSHQLYMVRVNAGLPDRSGNPMVRPVASIFTTVDYNDPRVVRLDPPVELPLPAQSTLRIKFNKAVDPAAFEEGGGATIRLEKLDSFRGAHVSDLTLTVYPDATDPSTIVAAPSGEAIAPSSFYRLTVAGARDTLTPANTQTKAQVFDYFSYDTVAPVVTIVSPLPAGLPLISGAGYLISASVTERATGAPSGDIAYVDWFESNGAVDTFRFRSKQAPFRYQISAPETDAPATLILKASATDLSGNTSDLATRTFDVVPNAAPSQLTIDAIPPAVYTGRHVTATVSFSDEGTIATVSLQLSGRRSNGTSYAPPAINQQVTRAHSEDPWPRAIFEIDVPADLAEGQPLALEVSVTDSSGNVSHVSGSVTTLTDLQDPAIVSLEPASGAHYQHGGTLVMRASVLDAESGVRHVTFTVDGKSFDVNDGDGGVTHDLSTGAATFAASMPVPPETSDTNATVTATAYDGHGNHASRSSGIVFDNSNDATVPTAAWMAPLNGAVLPAAQTMSLLLRIEATDDVQVTSVTFTGDAIASPVVVSAPKSGTGDIFETRVDVAIPADGVPLTFTATVRDADPQHDVVLPIVVRAVAVDQLIVDQFAITASNLSSYSGRNILVRGSSARLYADIPVVAKNLMVLDGATIGNPDGVVLDVAATDTVYVDGESSIDVTGKGFLGGWSRHEDGVGGNDSSAGMTLGGPAEGPQTAGGLAASGSYGGLGGAGLFARSNQPYGSVLDPKDFGTGGAGQATCCNRGGNGGGAIVLHGAAIGAHLVIAGRVSADGEANQGQGGSGSGGSILLSSSVVTAGPGSRITANGGDQASWIDMAGGGGGRIALSISDRLDLDGRWPVVQARGGRSGFQDEVADHLDGGAGTVLITTPEHPLGELRFSSLDERHPATAHLTMASPITQGLDLDELSVLHGALVRIDTAFHLSSGAAPNIDPTAMLLSPDDLPQLMLTSAPAEGSTLPQGASLHVAYQSAARPGMGGVSLEIPPAARADRHFTGYPLSTEGTIDSSVPFDQAPGAATMRLTMTDRSGRSIDAQRGFTVVANAPPVIDRFDLSATSGFAGSAITIETSATDDLAVSSLTLTSSVGTIDLISGTALGLASVQRSFRILLPLDVPGGTTVLLTLSASDNFPSRTATTRQATFTVQRDSSAPAIQIIAPLPHATFDVSSTGRIHVEARVEDLEVGTKQATAQLEGGGAMAMVAGLDDPQLFKADLPIPSVPGTVIVTKNLTVSASDYEGNDATSQPVPIDIHPVVDPDGVALTAICPTNSALLPSGSNLTVHLEAVPASPENGVSSLTASIGVEGTPVTLTAGAGNDWTCALVLPGAPDGTVVALTFVATTIRGNVTTLVVPITLVTGAMVTTDRTIGSNDRSLDGATVIVRGARLTMDGAHSFARLIVVDGGTVDQVPSDATRVRRIDITAPAIYVGCGAAIDVTGEGLTGIVDGTAYTYDPVNDRPTLVGGARDGEGGSHGGAGGFALAEQEYGSFFNPGEPGAAGSREGRTCMPCGGGGGVVAITGQQVVVDGALLANGVIADGGSGAGGAGGSIRVYANQISGSGSVRADGPVTEYHGSGGGGRIALSFEALDLHPGGVSALSASAAFNEGFVGSAGTIYTLNRSSGVSELTIANVTPTAGKTRLASIGYRTVASAGLSTVTSNGAGFTTDLAGVRLMLNYDRSRIWKVLGNSTDTLTLDTSQAPLVANSGDVMRGIIALTTVHLRNANLDSIDLLDLTEPLDKDESSTVDGNDSGPPLLNPPLITFLSSPVGAAIYGQAGAVTDAELPISLIARNLTTGAVFTSLAESDGSFLLPVQGSSGETIVLRARDTNAYPLDSAEIVVGSVPTTSGTPVEVDRTFFSNDQSFQPRLLAFSGSRLVVASPRSAGNPGSNQVAVVDAGDAAHLHVVWSGKASDEPVTDVKASGNWAYITGNRFATLNLSDGGPPHFAQDNPCGNENAVAVSGGYAFTAQQICSDYGSIHVYDVSDPSVPRFVGTQEVVPFRLEFSGLYTLGDKYLVGVSESAYDTPHHDVVIMDRSDVNHLVELSDLSIPNFGVSRARLDGSTLYAVSLAREELAIISLTDPLHPRLIARRHLTNAHHVLPLRDELLAAVGAAGLTSLSLTPPESLAISGAIFTGGSAWDVQAYDGSLFVANETGVAIVHESLPPAIDPSRVSLSLTLGILSVTGSAGAITGRAPLSLDVVESEAGIAQRGLTPDGQGGFATTLLGHPGDTVSLTVRDADGVVAGPIAVGTVPYGSALVGIPLHLPSDQDFRSRLLGIDGPTIVVAGPETSDNIVLVDATDPLHPAIQRIVKASMGGLRNLTVADGWAFITGSRLATLDLRTPDAPVNFETTDPCGRGAAVAVSGGYAFVSEYDCNNDGRIIVYDTSNPAIPRYVRDQAVGDFHDFVFTQLYPLGSDFLVALSSWKKNATNPEVTIIDRRDINNLVLASQLVIPQLTAWRGKVSGSTLYLTGMNGGEAAIDLSDPFHPVVASLIVDGSVHRGVDSTGPLVAVAAGTEGVVFYDHLGGSVRRAGSQAVGGMAWDVAFSESSLYIAAEEGLSIISGIDAPPRIDTTLIAMEPSGAVSGEAGAMTGAAPLSAVFAAELGQILASCTVASDGSFSSNLTGSYAGSVLLTVTDGSGRTNGPIPLGGVPFGHLLPTIPVVTDDPGFRAQQIRVDGDSLLLAGYDNSNRIAVVDLSNPERPALVRTLQGTSGPTGGVDAAGGWAFLYGARFSTLELHDNTAAVHLETSDPCGHGESIALSGPYAFVAESECNSDGRILIYNISDPAAPQYLRDESVGGHTGFNFTALYTLGSDYLVGISSFEPGGQGHDVTIIDRRDINHLIAVAELQIEQFRPWRGRIAGNTLYMTSLTGGIAVVDLSNPASPRLTARLDDDRFRRGLDVVGSTLIVAEGSEGAAFYDVSVEGTLKRLGNQPVGGNAWDLAVVGSTLYVANEEGLATITGLPPAMSRPVHRPASQPSSERGSAMHVGPSPDPHATSDYTSNEAASRKTAAVHEVPGDSCGLR